MPGRRKPLDQRQLPAYLPEATWLWGHSMVRRGFLLVCVGFSAVCMAGRAAAQAAAQMRAFMDRAFEMRRQAVAAGDQPYGAVVVKEGRIVAESPSRVVSAGNADAHAEREAIRLARLALKGDLAGCVLVSSSRPCGLCERAAFEARIARMIHGEALTDAGAPRG